MEQTSCFSVSSGALGCCWGALWAALLADEQVCSGREPRRCEHGGKIDPVCQHWLPRLQLCPTALPKGLQRRRPPPSPGTAELTGVRVYLKEGKKKKAAPSVEQVLCQQSKQPPGSGAVGQAHRVAPSPYFWPKPQEKWQLALGPGRMCRNWGVEGGWGSPPLAPGLIPAGAACVAARRAQSPGGSWFGARGQLPAQLLSRSLALPVGHFVCPCPGPHSGRSS